MIIKVDVDCVLADLTTEWLKRYTSRYNDPLRAEDVTSFKISQFAKYPTELMQILYEEDLYENVEPEPGAIEGIHKLAKAFGYARIVCVTSCERNQFDQKLDWLVKRGVINSKSDYVGAKDKTMVRGDMMIDDYEQNFSYYDKVRVLFGQPWNASKEVAKNMTTRFGPFGFVRVAGWKDFTDDLYRTLSTMHESRFRHVA